MATKKEIQYCIDTISDLAVRNYNKSKILPSLVVAQACWESGYLTSELADEANNPFGIKYNDRICRESYLYKNSKWCKFHSIEESVKAQGKFYNLYDRYSGIVGETDIEKVLIALENSGYCEGNGYSKNIKRMIDTYDLSKYDKHVLTIYDEMSVGNDKEYQKALNVFIKNNIVSNSSWLFTISNKDVKPLITKTCKYLYNVTDYTDGVRKLIEDNCLTSDIWYNCDKVKAKHIRSFIIKMSKYI